MISGTVSYDGSAVEGADIIVINATQEILEGTATTDASGYYEVTISNTGDTFHVGARWEGSEYQYTSESEAQVTDGDTVDFDLSVFEPPESTAVTLDLTSLWGLVDSTSDFSGGLETIAVHPDREYFVAIDDTDVAVRVYNYSNIEGGFQFETSFDIPASTGASRYPFIDFSPDGNWMFVATYDYNGNSNDGRLLVFDVSADDPTNWFEETQIRSYQYNYMSGVSVDRNGQFVAYTGSANVLEVYEIGTWRPRLIGQVDPNPQTTGFFPNSDRFAFGSTNGAAGILTMSRDRAWSAEQTFTDGSDRMVSVAITDDEEWMLFGCWDYNFYVYSNTGEEFQFDQSVNIGGSPYAIDLSPQDRYFVAPSGVDTTAGDVYLYDIPTWSSDISASPLTASGGTGVRATVFDDYLLYGDENGTMYAHSTPIQPQPDGVTVEITGTTSPISSGETLTVTANVTNTTHTTVTEDVTAVLDIHTLDQQSVTLNPGETQEIQLSGTTSVGVRGHGKRVTVRTEDDVDTAGVTIDGGWSRVAEHGVGGTTRYYGVDITPDESYFATLLETSTIEVYDYGGWGQVTTHTDPNSTDSSSESRTKSLVFSPDGQWMFVATASGISVWDVSASDPTNWAHSTTIAPATGSVATTVSVDPNSQFVGMGTDSSVEIFEVGTWNSVTTLGTDNADHVVHFSPYGTHAAIGNDGGSTANSIRVYTVGDASGSNWTEVFTATDPDGSNSEYVYSLRFIEDGNYLAAGTSTGNAFVYATDTGSLDRTLNPTNTITAIQFDDTAQYLMCTNADVAGGGYYTVHSLPDWSELPWSPLQETGFLFTDIGYSGGDYIILTDTHGEILVQNIPKDILTVMIDNTNSPIAPGETLTVDATVRNRSTDTTLDQTVVLEDRDGVQRDSTTVSLSPGASQTVTLSWDTTSDDSGEDQQIAVKTADHGDTELVDIANTITETFTSTGSHDWTVPDGISSVTIRCWGATGGPYNSNDNVGYAEATASTTGGETLKVNVGGLGGQSAGGTNGGGDGGAAGNAYGGGGMSDVRRSPGDFATDTIVVGAGGGGMGGGTTTTTDTGDGGAGGQSGTAGGNASAGGGAATASGGGGATDTSGGAAGTGDTGATTRDGTAGSQGQGGAGGDYDSGNKGAISGGGGGGGWYGGGGGGAAHAESMGDGIGAGAGGGGGANYIDSNATVVENGQRTVVNDGDGRVEIEYDV